MPLHLSLHLALALLLAVLGGPVRASPPCGGDAPRLQALAPGHWWVPAQPGDADAANRGQVSNLLLVRHGARLWLLGSGPSPQWARGLDCVIRQQLGRAVTDVISPWGRPELVLGAKTFVDAGARHWAHADVARELARQCPGCIARLRQRLGPAHTDLGVDPLVAPTHLVRGDRGRLGPWVWHRLERADGAGGASSAQPLTVWRVDGAGLSTAHGLVWAAGVPDLRDTDVAALRRALQALVRLWRAAPPRHVLGEQGPLADAGQAQAHLRYLRALQQEVLRQQAAGADGVQTPERLPGLDAADAARLSDVRHTLNWQRAWRQAEPPLR
jgi:hypothetical protein